jgi:hypothetical protein
MLAESWTFNVGQLDTDLSDFKESVVTCQVRNPKP